MNFRWWHCITAYKQSNEVNIQIKWNEINGCGPSQNTQTQSNEIKNVDIKWIEGDDSASPLAQTYANGILNQDGDENKWRVIIHIIYNYVCNYTSVIIVIICTIIFIISVIIGIITNTIIFTDIIAGIMV